MAKTRIQKQEEVRSLVEKLKRVKALVFSDYAKLTVPEVTELRKQLREEGVEYSVIKRSLLKRALAQSGHENFPLQQFGGSLALTFGYDDEIAPAKLLATFAKTHEAVVLRGGIISGAVYSSEQVTALAKLPSREELLAKILGSLVAPVTQFVRVASGPARGMVQVLRASVDARS